MFIEMALVVAGGVLGCQIVALVFRSRRKRLVAEARRPLTRLDGTPMGVAEQVWALRAVTGAPSAGEVLATDARTAEQISDVLVELSQRLNDQQQEAMTRRVIAIERARLQREEIKVILPALKQAAYHSAPALDLLLSQMVATAASQAAHGLFASLHGAFQDHAPAHVTDQAVGAGGEHLGSVLGHVPVFTIATTMARQRKAVKAGLDLQTATTHGLLDVSLRGGGAMVAGHVGMHALGTFVPVVGHVLGFALGVAGGLAGNAISNHIKERPLRDADAQFQRELASVGHRVPADAAKAFAAESYDVLVEQRQIFAEFDREVRHALQASRRPKWWPSLAQVVLSEALQIGTITVAELVAEVDELERLFSSVRSDPRGPVQLGALVVARRDCALRFDIGEAELASIATAQGRVEEERHKLQLSRGQH